MGGHTYVWAHVSMGTRIYGHTYLWARVSMGTRIYGHTYLWAHVSMGTRIYGHTYLWAHVSMGTQGCSFASILSVQQLSDSIKTTFIHSAKNNPFKTGSLHASPKDHKVESSITGH